MDFVEIFVVMKKILIIKNIEYLIIDVISIV